MQYDFNRFSKITKGIYKKYDKYERPSFSVDNILEIFRLYFTEYESNTGRQHPCINGENIIAIMNKITSCLDPVFNRYIDLEPDNYKRMIPSYFNTDYENCDYNINHFFSGKTRGIEYYKTLY